MSRPVGSQNKMGAQAKQELAQAFFDLGGRKALVKFAGENPEAFYKIWAKLIPNDARIELAVSHTITRNFTGKAAVALPVIEGEASEVVAGRVVEAKVEECEIDRSYKPEGDDDE